MTITSDNLQALIMAASAHGDAAELEEVLAANEDYRQDEDRVSRGAEIGDLIDMLNRFWAIMTPEQRTRAFQEGVEVVGEWIPK